jgi:hypothetical protein
LTAITKTTDGLNLLRDGGSGANNPLITYVALGTSNATPLASDHVLGNEVFRKKVTSFTNGASGELLINMYLAPGDSVGTDIEEVGFFGGNSATSSANSGVLIGHGLYSHNPKSAAESIQFQLDMTIS